MKRLTAAILVLCALLGCTPHYYRRQGEQLVFYLRRPAAESVEFAASTDGFTVRSATRVSDNLWKIEVPVTGEFSYFYIVDGAVHLPPCPLTEKDDFGSTNCLFVPKL